MNAVAFAHGEVPPADWYEHLTDNPEEARLWRSQALLELVSRRALG